MCTFADMSRTFFPIAAGTTLMAVYLGEMGEEISSKPHYTSKMAVHYNKHKILLIQQKFIHREEILFHLSGDVELLFSSHLLKPKSL